MAEQQLSKQTKMAMASQFLGFMLDAYDMAMVLVMAPILVKVFVSPKGSAAWQYIVIVFSYSITMASRPIGSAIFGRYADKIGRRFLLVLTIGGVGVMSLLGGFLPTYAQIGVWSYVIFCLLRLLMGVFFGGEYAVGHTFAIEYAPQKKRGAIGASPSCPASFRLWGGLNRFRNGDFSIFPSANFYGWLSDRTGRKILTQWYCVFLVVFGIPVFYVLYHAAIQRNLWMAIAGCVMAAMLKLAWGVVPAYLCERFPTRRRAAGVGFGYSSGALLGAWFSVYVWWAHKIPFIAAIEKQDMWLSPAVILTVGAVMTFISLWYSPETKHLQLDEVGEKERASDRAKDLPGVEDTVSAA
jgi:MFS family permease